MNFLLTAEGFFLISHFLKQSTNASPKKLFPEKASPSAARYPYSPQRPPNFHFTGPNGMAVLSNRTADDE
jgi:hypothetical protein